MAKMLYNSDVDSKVFAEKKKRFTELGLRLAEKEREIAELSRSVQDLRRQVEEAESAQDMEKLRELEKQLDNL